MKITHILIPSDLSEEALRPCLPVGLLARALGARVTLLHVTQNLAATALGGPTQPVFVPPDLDQIMASAREHLERQRALFPGVDLQVEVVMGLDATYEILEYARANHVDLIAMSTHGRTGFRRLVLGSVVEAVLRRSTVPVVVFPREDEQQEEK